MPNRLAAETSPYLQQHADNPVDWYPWSPQALQLARDQDKPILLSIGYSACHWCHVMAHESFEDPAVAAVMNRLFVNIKVDREERPDLDQIYQAAQQMLTGRTGGWPLTMFLTPTGTPFFGGTYFPKTPRYGLPGFPDLLSRVAQGFTAERPAIEAQNRQLQEALAKTLPQPSTTLAGLDAGPITATRKMLGQSFDADHGGFGPAPKFPHAGELAFLLRRHAMDQDGEARHIAFTTLARMAEGGIHDQLGGGFSRYSVDERWEIPHFEKMLYDNGPLLALYADAWAISGEPLFKAAAEGIATWVLREMQSPEGGYYSALDADSEGEEGKFYVWSREEVQQSLSPEEYAVAARHWGLDKPPNFENSHWHLRVAMPLGPGQQDLLASARDKLFRVRERRVRPGRDEKILTSWNALMIEGMAHAARVLDRPEWLASARRALDFVRKTMWREVATDAYGAGPSPAGRSQHMSPPSAGRGAGGRHRLLATYKDGKAHLDAYLDDHAFLIKALIEMLQAGFRSEDLAFAQDLAQALLDNFADKAAGGFFFTRHDHEALIHRPKPGYDNATPSGNGIAALALQRLAMLDAAPAGPAAAESTLRLFRAQMQESGGNASLLHALEEYRQPPRLIVLRGPDDPVRQWQRKLDALPLAQTLTLALGEDIEDLPPTLAKPSGAEVNAWVCRGVTCLPPIADWQELQHCLEQFP